MKERNFQPGDRVLIADPNTQRGQWKIGRVTEAISRSDGLVRVVKVQTETTVYLRPIHRLCLLGEKSTTA